MKYLIMTLTILFSIHSSGQHSITGKVIDESSCEGIMIGTVILYKHKQIVKETQTDFNGNYFLNDIPPGHYYMVASYVGYKDFKTKLFTNKESGIELDITMKRSDIRSCEMITKSCGSPYIIDFGNLTQKRVIHFNKNRPISYSSF